MHATNMIPGLSNSSYSDCLKALDLPTISDIISTTVWRLNSSIQVFK